MLSIRVVGVVPLENAELFVFFEDGKLKRFDIKKLFPEYPEYKALLNPDLFNMVRIEPGGYGISWNGELDCSEGELYAEGKDIPVNLNDFISFCKHNLITTKNAASILNCSKQNIDDLVKRGKLHPVRFDERYNLFLKSEVYQRALAAGMGKKLVIDFR